jgi:thiamine kinase-like enzyme
MVRTAGSLSDADLLAILDAVPSLRVPEDEPARSRRVERIEGGLTNVNVKVTFPDRTLVARIATDDSVLLSIDRDAEYVNSLAAARAGVAPEVAGRSAAEGVLVVEWVEGRTLAAADLRDDANLPRIARACRQLHAGPRFAGDFDIFQIQRRYLRIVTERGFRLPAGYLDLMPAFEEVRRALAVHPPVTVPCHNDLFAENLIDDGRRLWLIDFEYAGNGDACFELGNLGAESGLDHEQLAELVRLYHGPPDRDAPESGEAALRRRIARTRTLALASTYVWTLWASIQNSASTVDFDFWAWGLEKYERAVEEFADPGLDRLLEEVAAGV